MKRKKTKAISPRQTTQFDVIVGQKIASRRKTLGITQTDLAAASSITFQQVQKYENGKNRVSISRLCEFARKLGCGVNDLLPNAEVGGKPVGDENLLGDKFAVRAAKYMNRVKDPKMRERMLKMIQGMATAA